VSEMIKRQCLVCGLEHRVAAPSLLERTREPLCVKCDSPLFSVGDGSQLTVDIAHQHETVKQALAKFELTLERVWQTSHVSDVRLVVGGGLIRDAVLAELHFRKTQGTVPDFREENRGAVLVRLRGNVFAD
jgi:predicted CXXCH cytochrome family protein